MSYKLNRKENEMAIITIIIGIMILAVVAAVARRITRNDGGYGYR